MSWYYLIRELEAISFNRIKRIMVYYKIWEQLLLCLPHDHLLKDSSSSMSNKVFEIHMLSCEVNQRMITRKVLNKLRIYECRRSLTIFKKWGYSNEFLKLIFEVISARGDKITTIVTALKGYNALVLDYKINNINKQFI